MDVLVSAWKMFWKLGRKLIGWAWAIVVAVGTLVPVAIIYDVPPYVGDPDATGTDKVEKLPKGVSTNRIWLSVWTWIIVLPVLIWLAQAVHAGALLGLLVVVPVGTFLFARRISASKNTPMTVGEWMAQLGGLLRPELPDEPELSANPAPDEGHRTTATGPKARVQNRYQALLIAYLVASLAAIGVALSTLILKDLPTDITLLFTLALPWYPVAALVAHIALFLPIAAKAAVLHSEYEYGDGGTEAHLAGKLARVLGTSENEWYAHTAEFTTSPAMDMITIAPTPTPALAKLGAGLEERLIAYFGDWAIQQADRHAVILVTLDQMSPEFGASRRAKESTNGLITGFIDLTDSELRPEAARWSLDARARIQEVEAQARAQGLTVVEHDDIAHTVVVARLSPTTVQLRHRLAEMIGTADRNIEMRLASATELAGTDLAHKLIVQRAAIASKDTEKRRAFWLENAQALLGTPDGHIWRFEEDARTGAVTLDCAVDPLRELIPYSADPATRILPNDRWVVGRDEAGTAVSIDLANSAHMLIAGATRSGKSVCTYSLITHVLRMGPAARLLVADPNDTTIAPFEHLVSWSTSATNPEPVTEMLQWVRSEMDRRKPILREMRRDKVDEFTAEMPLIVVVIDEAANYMKHADKAAAMEMTSELLAVVSQGAKYGVRLVLITQRPDSTILPTAVRSQLSARISFRVEALEDAKMTFPDIDSPAELLTFAAGVGLIKEVAGQPRRFRSEFLEDHWDAADRVAEPLPRVDITQVSAAPQAPEVIDRGEMEFSIEDLEDDQPPIDPAFDFAQELTASEAPATESQPAPAWPMPAAAPQPRDVDPEYVFTP